MDNKDLIEANNKSMSESVALDLLDRNFRVIKTISFKDNFILLKLMCGKDIQLEVIEEC